MILKTFYDLVKRKFKIIKEIVNVKQFCCYAESSTANWNLEL